MRTYLFCGNVFFLVDLVYQNYSMEWPGYSCCKIGPIRFVMLLITRFLKIALNLSGEIIPSPVLYLYLIYNVLEKYFARVNVRSHQASKSTFTFASKFYLFVGPLIPLFWTSGDICHRFQNQGVAFLQQNPHIRFWCETCRTEENFEF